MDTVSIGDVLVLEVYKDGSKHLFFGVKNITKTGKYRLEALVSKRTLVSEKNRSFGCCGVVVDRVYNVVPTGEVNKEKKTKLVNSKVIEGLYEKYDSKKTYVYEDFVNTD